MPAKDSPDVLVARYLRDHGYELTFQAFLEELNLDPRTISNEPDDLTIEKVLEEKRLYDLSIKFEKADLSEDDKPFTRPYPSTPLAILSGRTSSNVLFVTSAELQLASDHEDEPQTRNCIIATTADKHMRIFSVNDGFELLRDARDLHVAPILSVVAVDRKRLLSCSMSGEVLLSDADTGKEIDRRKDHSKYVVKLAVWKDDEAGVLYVATAGYDKRVAVYKLSLAENAAALEVLGSLELQATVEEVIFTRDYRSTTEQQSNGSVAGQIEPLLAVTVRDSPFLQYYTIGNNELKHSHKYALSMNSTSWAVFSAMTVLPNPCKPHILAIATSSVPEMKLIILDQTDGSILKEVFTGSPQGAYSNAVLAWRPDGSGLWTNSDDGIIRGIGSRTGKVEAELKEHTGKGVCQEISPLHFDNRATFKHNRIAKGNVEHITVRTLWAGHIDGQGEVLLSGSFDTKLVLWSLGG